MQRLPTNKVSYFELPAYLQSEIEKNHHFNIFASSDDPNAALVVAGNTLSKMEFRDGKMRFTYVAGLDNVMESLNGKSPATRAIKAISRVTNV